MTGSAIIDLPTLTVGLAITALWLALAIDGRQLTQPVDSYICIQAETNRVPNRGCRFSQTEKP